MSRPTYHQHVKKQKERAKKARQEEKQQRRSARLDASAEAASEGTLAQAGAPCEPVSPTTS